MIGFYVTLFDSEWFTKRNFWRHWPHKCVCSETDWRAVSLYGPGQWHGEVAWCDKCRRVMKRNAYVPA